MRSWNHKGEVISIFNKGITRGDAMEVRGVKNKESRSKGRTLNHAGIDGKGGRRLGVEASEMGAVEKEIPEPLISGIREGKAC